MNKTLALLSVALLSACADGGFSRAMSYPTDNERLRLPDSNWRIFEHESEPFLMVVPSNGDLVASGTTFGAVGLPTLGQYQNAAETHLRNTGRGNCTITSSALVVTAQYEFRYSC